MNETLHLLDFVKLDDPIKLEDIPVNVAVKNSVGGTIKDMQTILSNTKAYILKQKKEFENG